MNTHQSVTAQAIVRQNAEERTEFLLDLEKWEDSIKKKDEELCRQKAPSLTRRRGKGNDTISCKRNEITETNVRSNLASTKQNGDLSSSVADVPPSEDGTISCPADSKGSETIYTSSNNSENLENDERQKGNNLFKNGDYHGAIRSYTIALRINPRSALAYSNRAMAHLKLKDWLNAESDAATALSLDPTHVKSYQRRSAARFSLGKLRASLLDLEIAKIASGGTATTEMKVEEAKVRNALRRAIERAPKRRIPIVIDNESNRIVADERKVKMMTTTTDNSAVHKESTLSPSKNTTAVPAPTLKYDNNNKKVLHTQLHDDKISFTSSVQTPSTKTSHIRRNNTKQRNIITSSTAAAATARATAPPQTLYEFETQWRSHITEKQRHDLLKIIKPRHFQTIFKNGINDVDMLVEILQAVTALPEEQSFEYVRVLSRLKQLDIVVMMMTKEQRDSVRECLRRCLGREAWAGDAGGIASKFGC
mmetsp:Transcript_12680/g.16006  ORF Transcript_12680/g.16006 Transcript_12680/m.16006 type:complete len:479 (-) Transcript_12680:189-1625(-)